MACACNLDTIGEECNRNAPGLKTVIHLACVDDISSIGAATSHAVSTITPVTTDPVSGFVKFNITRKDNDEKTTPNENGGYTTEVKGFIAKQSAAKSAILTLQNGVENKIAITEDQNGLKDIIGSLSHPCSVSVESVKTPKNGYNITIKWEEHADLPYIFTGTIPLAA